MANKKTVGLSAGALALLLAIVPQFEGKRNVGYRDPVGIATKCFGDTNDVRVGQSYSDEVCLAALKTQLAAHGAGVLACVPGLAGHDDQLAAAVDFAYNVGVGAFCRSAVARRFKAGDWRGACAEFSKWIYAGGKVLPGLVKRRAAERALCEKGL